MHRFTVEVDDEVYAFLDAEATSRLETHNTVLRRRLLPQLASGDRAVDWHSVPGRKVRNLVPIVAPAGLPSFPPGTPSALQQILWVAHLVRAKGRSRPEASSDVARLLRVATQTVNDKYGRQLGLTADRFDVLLREPSLKQFETLLAERFPQYRSTIQTVLKDLRRAA